MVCQATGGWEHIVRKVFRKVFPHRWRAKISETIDRVDAINSVQKIVQIGAILVIFRPFEVFAERPTVAPTSALAPMWLEFGGDPPSM